MSSEKMIKLSEQVDRGLKGQAVLDSLEDAFDALEADCFDTFKKSELHDDDGRKACRMYIRVMEDVKKRFTKAVRSGEAARKELIKLTEDKQNV
jgi:hypothetical protein